MLPRRSRLPVELDLRPEGAHVPGSLNAGTFQDQQFYSHRKRFSGRGEEVQEFFPNLACRRRPNDGPRLAGFLLSLQARTYVPAAGNDAANYLRQQSENSGHYTRLRIL